MLIYSIATAGCTGPWPSAEVDTSGLGDRPIGETLRNSVCIGFDEREYREEIEVLLNNAVSHSGNRRLAAESIGMSCSISSKLSCKYSGRAVMISNGAPPPHPPRIKETIDIQITLDSDHNIAAHKQIEVNESP